MERKDINNTNETDNTNNANEQSGSSYDSENTAVDEEHDDIGFIGIGTDSYGSDLFGTDGIESGENAGGYDTGDDLAGEALTGNDIPEETAPAENAVFADTAFADSISDDTISEDTTFADSSYEDNAFEDTAPEEKAPEKRPVRRASGRTGGLSLHAGKKIILFLCAITGIAAIIALGVGVFGAANGPSSVFSEEDNFQFANGTMVSGFDISGRTVKEAKEFLEQNKNDVITPVSISVNVGDKKVELTQDCFEYDLNVDEVLGAIKADDEAGKLTSAQSYTLTATVSPGSIDSNVNTICEENNTEPVNARVKKFHAFADERFEYEEEKNGVTVDGDNLKQQLTQFFAGGQDSASINAVVTETEPETTVDFLKENIVELCTYETVSGNTDDATVNMEVSFNSCNESIIEPGEDWSFNTRTGDSNLESRGYKIGNVISDDQVTDGVGGGLCQSSSTIYIAALYSNMAVVERHEHKWASLYVPTGFDATIDYPNLDLVLKNISDYQMFLECRVIDKTLYATFWGVHSADYDYITLGNELVSSDKSGYSVKTWREFYKDGEKAWQEELPGSHYDPENGEQFVSA